MQRRGRLILGGVFAGAIYLVFRWASRSKDQDTLAHIRHYYDRSAGQYDRVIPYFDRLLLNGGRRWVTSKAQGDVLEIAVGTGRNLPYYDAHVHLTGIDLSPEMLRIARRRAEGLEPEIHLDVGDAQALNFPDASFDTVVSTLSLCTIPDHRQAISEAKRVLRPGGRFLALEHVRSPLLLVRLVQRMLDPLMVRLADDHLLRDPVADFTTLGFGIEQLDRSKLGIIERVVARKPD